MFFLCLLKRINNECELSSFGLRFTAETFDSTSVAELLLQVVWVNMLENVNQWDIFLFFSGLQETKDCPRHQTLQIQILLNHGMKISRKTCLLLLLPLRKIKGRTDGRTDEQRTNEWTDGRKNKQTDGRTDEQMNEQTDGRTNKWTDERTNETKTNIQRMWERCCLQGVFWDDVHMI